MNEILFYIFIAVGLINTVHLGLYIGGANMYDIWQLRRKKKLAAQKPARKSKLPLVSVIVPAHNEELVIERCLDSIRLSDYPKIEAIVHNDKSTDKTAKILRDYKKRYPEFKLHYVNRRKQAGKAGGVNHCIQKFAKGELIMTLDADCVLRPDAISNSVSYFSDKRIAGVAANVRLIDKHRPLGILQQYEHLVGYRSKKFYTMTDSEYIIGGVASTYRRSVLDMVDYYDTDTLTEDIGLSTKVVAHGNKQYRIIYAYDVVAMTEGVHSFKGLLKQRYRWKMGSLQNLVRYFYMVANPSKIYTRMLTMYRLPMAILSEIILLIQPIILSYVIYLSVHYETMSFFVGAYITITIYMLWTIWPDEHASVKRKFAMSLYAPVLYFLFFVMDFVQIVAIIRCLLHPKQIANKTTKHALWVSPERAGQAVQFS